jgi:hypothetical protein
LPADELTISDVEDNFHPAAESDILKKKLLLKKLLLLKKKKLIG